MKKLLIMALVVVCLDAQACRTGYYLVVNKTQTSLWFETKDACKRGARELNLLTGAYKCIPTK